MQPILLQVTLDAFRGNLRMFGHALENGRGRRVLEADVKDGGYKIAVQVLRP